MAQAVWMGNGREMAGQMMKYVVCWAEEFKLCSSGN